MYNKVAPVLKPLNRHLTIIVHKNLEHREEQRSAVILPDDYKENKKSRYVAATVLEIAPDCSTAFQKIKTLEREKRTIIIDSSMTEEIEYRDKKYTVILENYVMGFLRGFNETEDL